MFGAPERKKIDDTIIYFIPIVNPVLVGVKYEIDDMFEIQPSLEGQEKLQTLQNTILSELINNEQLFKNRPTMESLQAITPNWGCIIVDGKVKWNPYTKVSHNNIVQEQLPCYIDLLLEGIFLSRSTIYPQFSAVFSEKLGKNSLIDFDWNPVAPEVEEISDVVFPEAGSIKLRDPLELLKVKQEAKLAVQIAFQKAIEAKNVAINMAKQFMNEFDISDNESTFTEWLEEEDQDNLS